MRKSELNSRKNLFLILIVVSAVFVLSTILQFYIYLNKSIEELDQNMNAILTGVRDRLSTIDKLYYSIEMDLDRKMEPLLKEMDDLYRVGGNIDFINDIPIGDSNINLFIIDENNTVVKTTDPVDLNLNFGNEGVFTEFLDRVRDEGGYHSERIALSIITFDIKKYVYFGSHDHKYIFEAGYDMNAFSAFLGDDSLSNLISGELTNSKHLLDVRVLNNAATSYTDDIILSETEMPQRYNAHRRSYENNTESVVVINEGMFFKNTYHYIPFVPRGNNSGLPTLVIEVGYTDRFIKEYLLYQFLLQVAIILSFLLLIVYMFKTYEKNFLNPLKIVYDGMIQVSHDKLERIEEMSVKNELKFVGDTFNIMISKLKESFETIKSQNEELEFQVEERTVDLTEANTSLSKTISELEKAQMKLIDKERIESINKVIIEISHRLNTPLGNSISYLSFVEGLLKDKKNIGDEDMEDAYSSITLALKNLTVSAQVISSFRDISEINIISVKDSFNFITFINENLHYYSNLVKKENQRHVNILCDSNQQIRSNRILLERVFEYLLRVSSINDNVYENIVIELIENEENYIIKYYDSFSFSGDDRFEITDVLNAFSFHSVISGLELFLIRNIITIGLSGDVKVIHSDETSKNHILITLPK